MAAKKWNKVILFGDSLTQRAFEPSDGLWGSLLADKLQRVSDVIVRGFSGYNSRWLRMICDQIFDKTMNASEVSCLTILLGANDSCDAPSQQHVPIDEFADNLSSIIDHLETTGITRERILLMSPPVYCHQKFTDFCRQNGKTLPQKDEQTVAKYAEAVGRTAHKSGVEFIDLFQHFSKQQNKEQLFCDGLHFSRIGSQLLFQLIWPSIEKRVQNHNQSSDLIPIFPQFEDIDRKNPQKSLLK
ncbi:unnamed protein product [Medioppia subpectinata]|uniref:SGNH hydrolase-type esterase domain-containing protein n=1 Tax=Medioppia subpectinata TaxID=1979941 RepID=A0A7R9PW38_9ACAR|nr:unnamed protein product [Medioppia subpectinata]CAG2103518.1 unnamed protein product [Medioppia subpectinata]